MRLDWNKRVRFVALGSPEAERVLGHLGLERFESSHVLRPDGVLESGGDSALTLLSLLPLTAPLAWVWRLVPGHRQLTERAYRWVAENRYRFSPNATCGMRKPAELSQDDAGAQRSLKGGFEP